MITVTFNFKRIEVGGHARFAPKGQDIVCSAVSALTIALVEGLSNHGQMEDVKATIEDGHAEIEWFVETIGGLALINTYKDAIRGIAEEYPQQVRIINDNQRA